MADELQTRDARIAELAGHFRYLDELRESGRTNMWGAPAYLRAERYLDEDEANVVHGQWMDTFDGKSTPLERATRAAL